MLERKDGNCKGSKQYFSTTFFHHYFYYDVQVAFKDFLFMLSYKGETAFYHYETVTSTNDVAMSLLEEVGENTRVVVISDYQTSGRGRNNKVWVGEEKENLYYSFGLRHNTKDLPIHLLQVIGVIATYTALSSYSTSKHFAIKYPNDVYGIEHGIPKKIAGIISESNFMGNGTMCNSIIGIGVNMYQEVFPQEISSRVTSLKRLGDITDEISQHKLAVAISHVITDLLVLPENTIMEEWKWLLHLEHNVFRIISDGDTSKLYAFKDYMPDGRLLLAENSDPTKTRIIDNGDSIFYDLISGSIFI
jgi:biotin-[acetyl-CoA-carboxylase] ligase BirA-like protein